MSKYVTINLIQYPISAYNFRLRKTADLSSTSYIFRCTLHSKIDVIAIDDPIGFYSDGILIYSGDIKLKTSVGSVLQIESTKNLAGTPSTHTLGELFYYSTSSLRFPLNFNIYPYDTVQTVVGDFVVNEIVHYDIYSEVTYG